MGSQGERPETTGELAVDAPVCVQARNSSMLRIRSNGRLVRLATLRSWHTPLLESAQTRKACFRRPSREGMRARTQPIPHLAQVFRSVVPAGARACQPVALNWVTGGPGPRPQGRSRRAVAVGRDRAGRRSGARSLSTGRALQRTVRLTPDQAWSADRPRSSPGPSSRSRGAGHGYVGLPKRWRLAGCPRTALAHMSAMGQAGPPTTPPGLPQWDRGGPRL
jgi:hypothetical protein